MNKIILPTLVISSFLFSSALSAQQAQSITGNPLGGQDNFTVNSNEAKTGRIECVFINSGVTPAKIDVWTDPTEGKAHQSLILPPGSKTKPSQILKVYIVELEKHWWCRIYTPHEDVGKWRYCSYFSIADNTLVEYKPFSKWDKTKRSITTSYHCKLLKPNKNIQFFYFRDPTLDQKTT